MYLFTTTSCRSPFHISLQPLEEESFMIYKQVNAVTGAYQVGILAAIDVEDCKNNIIKRHERTTKDVDVICSEKVRNYRVIFTAVLRLPSNH